MTEDEYLDKLGRIVRGAEFIENLSPTDAKYKPAMEKYNRLVREVLEYQRKERERLGY
ncbi:hypothetical protein [Paenibacillus senegalensis]|uniref:hypothetical protein n=1 Tax=Paenibacillus senegalensis TaxID=1465766 RepID=UPI0002F64828|nr:hypothetical protein [Paenibacillus senegalensis]